ncbi:MAG: DUF433 domain-containing protein [bacterium]|nr:DUF433 domain-containing protein [bacterium]
MARYSLKLPPILKQEAEQWARRQEISLNQFIIWALSEKVGALKQKLDDPRFPHVTYRLGASRWPAPVVRGTGIRVQTLAIASSIWGLPAEEIAEEYGLPAAQVADSLAFYAAHRVEIDAAITEEEELEAGGG